MSRPDASAAATALANESQRQQQHAGAEQPAATQQQQQSIFTSQNLPGNRYLSSAAPPPPSNADPVQNSGQAYGRPQLNSNGPLLTSSPQFSNGPPPISAGCSPALKSVPQMSSSGSQFNSSAQQVNSGPGGSLLTRRSPINNGPLTTSRMQAYAGPLPSNVPLSNSAQPSLNNGPHPGSRPPSGLLLNSAPPLTSGPSPSSAPQLTSGSLPNSGAPQLSNSGSINSRPLLGNGPPLSSAPIQSSGPAGFNSGFVNSRPPLSSGPLLTSAPQQSSGPALSSGPMYTSGLAPNIKSPISSGSSLISAPQQTSGSAGPVLGSGPMYTSSPNIKSPVSSAPLLNSGPLLTTSSHLTSPTSPTSIGGLPPYSAPLRPVINSGPPLNTRPLINSGPPMNNGLLLNASGPPSVPPLSSGPPAPGSTGPALNSIPPMQRVDPNQGLSHQFQNVSLSGATAPYPYKSEQPIDPMSQMNSQAYSTTNRPLDIRSSNYLASGPCGNQTNHQQPMSVTKQGFNKIWGTESVDIIQCRNVLPVEKIEPPRIKLHQELLDRINCSPEIFRCTLTKIPESNSLLQKVRLPLGILIHPFKDLNHLPVIQCNTIVRCRSCRTYINPFVYFVDSKRWKCNLCFKVNELPDEFQFDPATKSYGDPSRRPEIRTSTIEFIAPSEYMLRPPQPAVYLFIFDVSRLAVESGYLALVCNIIAEEMSRMPGDGRTQIGFLAVDSAVHFFSMPENVSQPHHMVMMDVDDVFLPHPENLVVNLKEREELLKNLLGQLPQMFKDTHDTNCALGAALQVAYKLMSPTGGRVTVFQTCLPNVGPGSLQSREDPNARAGKDVPYLNPATDFYKRLALDCSGQQVAVDLFLLNCQYSDLSTLSGICKFSGGCIYNIALFQASKLPHVELLDKMLRRYLSRKVGFEAVMRIRCTRGISIHTFHGNFFVRSTDLLSLPNVNPDAGFGMQLNIDENLSDTANVCFQAALLYTSSKGERRIRVHTLCLPTTSSLSDVLYSADQQCIVGLIAKMAVDRSVSSSLSDAREALINAVVDSLSAYKLLQAYPGAGLLAPVNLKLLPMYIIALLKSRAFRFGVSTRIDDRFYAMCQLKSLPLCQLIQFIYPDLYAVHDYVNQQITEMDDGQLYPIPDRLHLSAEKLDSRGVFLLDHCDQILIYVGKNVHPSFCFNVLGVPSFAAIPEEMYGLPELTTPESDRLRTFIASLQDEKPYCATLQVIRDDGHFRTQFTERLIEDRLENALSYYEFLQHIKTQVK